MSICRIKNKGDSVLGIGMINGTVTMKEDVGLFFTLHKWEKGKTYKYKRVDDSIKLECNGDYVTLHEPIEQLEKSMIFEPGGVLT